MRKKMTRKLRKSLLGLHGPEEAVASRHHYQEELSRRTHLDTTSTESLLSLYLIQAKVLDMSISTTLLYVFFSLTV
jgi:hypothetical protein